MSFLSLNSRIIDTIIFDFDGTLAKLNIDFQYMRDVIDQIISNHGLDPTRLQNGYVLEKIREAAMLLQNQSSGAGITFHAEAFKSIESIELDAAKRGDLFERTKPLLMELQQRGIRTGIITRNCKRAVHTVFPDVSSYCFTLVCRDDVREVKPHPEHLITALNKLGSQPEKSLMVGDHPLDIKTGQNAKTLTAGVLSGHFEAHDFLKAGADIVLHQAADILTKLNFNVDGLISC